MYFSTLLKVTTKKKKRKKKGSDNYDRNRKRGGKKVWQTKRDDRKIYTCLHDVRHDRIAMFVRQLKEVEGKKEKGRKEARGTSRVTERAPPSTFHVLSNLAAFQINCNQGIVTITADEKKVLAHLVFQ